MVTRIDSLAEGNQLKVGSIRESDQRVMRAPIGMLPTESYREAELPVILDRSLKIPDDDYNMVKLHTSAPFSSTSIWMLARLQVE